MHEFYSQLTSPPVLYDGICNVKMMPHAADVFSGLIS